MAKEISKLTFVGLAEGANRMQGSGITGTMDKDEEDSCSEDNSHVTFLQSDAVWCSVLSAFYLKKKKLSEKAFVALNNLLLCHKLNLNVATKIFMHPYTTTSEVRSSEASTSLTSVSCSVGEGVLEVLTEYLCVASDPNVQLCILFRLQELLNGKGQAFLAGRSITRILRSVFAVSAWACQESLRERCHKVLKQCVLCVTRRFVKESLSTVTCGDAASEVSSYRFSTATPLDNYTTHIPPDAPYMCIDVVDTSAPASEAERRTFTASEELSQAVCDSSSAVPASFDPHRLFPVSLKELVLRLGAQALRPQPKTLPTALKGLLLLLRVVCEMASNPCSGTSNEGGRGPRLRQLALDLLQLVFVELPVANSAEEHPCSRWMSLVLIACRFELIRCLVHNLFTTTPFLLFDTAIQILKLLLIKCYYHLGRELHTTVVVFLLPLVKSKHCAFRHKCAVLSMLRDLFSLSDLLISFFLNYDCNPAIGAEGYNGDMVVTLVDFVVEIAYLDYTSEVQEGSHVSQEEKQHLQSECFSIMHIFTNSLYRWIAEDPEAPISSPMAENNTCRNGIGRIPSKILSGTYSSVWKGGDAVSQSPGISASDTLSMLKSHHDAANLSQSHISSAPVSNVNIDLNISFPDFGHISQVKKPNPNTTTLPGESCIQYHWKHLHYQLNNKCMLQKAARMVNTGKWKEAKNFLESRRCLSVRMPSEVEQKGDPGSGGSSSYAEFARFLYEYPGISRDAINKIIGCVNGKVNHENLVLLRDYFSLFNYRRVPIDIAFRDTLCKFVSWEAPMFETQVWESIQNIFGEAYAKQNPLVITEKDAQSMAGALLFLHTNFHNRNAKNISISLDQFISASVEFLDFPPDVEDVRKIFERVKKKKWDLDMYDRTPQEVERQLRQDQIFSGLFTDQLLSRYRGEQSIQPRQLRRNTSATNLDCATKDVASAVNTIPNEGVTQRIFGADDDDDVELWQTLLKQEKNPTPSLSNFTSGEYERNEAKLKLPKVGMNIAETPLVGSANDITFSRADDYPTNLGSSHDCDSTSTATDSNALFSPSNFEDSSWFLSGEIDLLNSKAPAYIKGVEKSKVHRNHQSESIEVSIFYLKKLEAVHMRFFGDYADYHPQPYIYPHYAEHIQPLLLLTYPKIMSCIYLGFNVTEVAPLRWQLLETLQRLYDIAAAFMINVSDQQASVVEAVQQYLTTGDAHWLISHTRAMLVPLLICHI